MIGSMRSFPDTGWEACQSLRFRELVGRLVPIASASVI